MYPINMLFPRMREMNLFSTIYLNFVTLPFDQAIRFPILIYGKVTIKNARKARLIFHCPLRMGILQIEKNNLGFIDKKRCCSIWNVAGTLHIYGKAGFGQGCCVEVGRNAVLTLGENFNVTGRSTLLCQNSITFGNECLLSWDLLIMDNDWHQVASTVDGRILNPSKPITIGNHVWIGCRSIILKGVSISDNVIVAANSTITRRVDKEFVAVSSNGVLKENVKWDY